MVRELKAVERVFALGQEEESRLMDEVDVLELIKTVIACVRSTRNFGQS